MGELEVRGVWIASVVLRRAGRRRSLDGRRLVQDRRHRHDRAERLHRDPGPLQGSRQVGWRVDLDGRARERADGASRHRRGSRDRDPGREVVGAAAGGLRAAARGRRRHPTSCGSSSRRSSRSGGSRTGSSSSTSSRRPRSASSARPRCASSSRIRSRRPDGDVRHGRARRRGRDRDDRQPADECALVGAAGGAGGRARPARPRRRRPARS